MKVKETIYETPKLLPDGSKYQIIRIDGRFYQPFDLKSFPLDTQQLSIYLEDTTNIYTQVVFIADSKNTRFESSMSIPGWSVSSLVSQTLIHDYVTNFGDTSIAENASKYTSLKFSLSIERQLSFFWWKLLFPLIIVLLTNWFALLLKPTFVDLRTAMPATALLTTIFLQVSYGDKLPDVSYVVLMDKIYALVYVCIILTLIQIIWGNRKLKGAEAETIWEGSNSEHEDSVITSKIMRIDIISVVLQLVMFASVMTFFLVMK